MCHMAKQACYLSLGSTPVNCEGREARHFLEDPEVAYVAVGVAHNGVNEASSL